MTEIDRSSRSRPPSSGHWSALVALVFVAATCAVGLIASGHVAGGSSGVRLAGAAPLALGVPAPTTNTSALDLGFPLNVSVDPAAVTGGSGNLSALGYAWHGLPTSCASQNVSNYSCTPTATGTFSITVTVTDYAASLSATSSAVSVTVNTDPTLTSFTVSASSIGVGGTVTFTANATGGTAPLTFVYSGLPAGCVGNTSVVSCTPNAAQTYTVSVYVVDSASTPVSTDSKNVTVDVTASTSSGSPAPTALDWAIIGVILLVGFAVVALLLVRARREERQGYSTQRRASGPPPARPPSTGGTPPTGGAPPGA